MAVVRHFALNLVRIAADRKSLKLRRKRAAWATDYLNQLLAAQVSKIWFRGPGHRRRRIALRYICEEAVNLASSVRVGGRIGGKK
jgi:hypothetical protein